MDEQAIMTGPMRLEIKRILNGPIERVWEYLTDGSLRQQWFYAGQTGTEPGEDMVFEFDHSRLSMQRPPPKYADSNSSSMSGKVLVYEKPSKLKFTREEIHGEGTSTVTILLKDLGGKTRLHLIHEELESDAQSGAQAGWHAHLNLLLDLFDGKPARDFWLHFNALGEARHGRTSPSSPTSSYDGARGG